MYTLFMHDVFKKKYFSIWTPYAIYWQLWVQLNTINQICPYLLHFFLWLVLYLIDSTCIYLHLCPLIFSIDSMPFFSFLHLSLCHVYIGYISSDIINFVCWKLVTILSYFFCMVKFFARVDIKMLTRYLIYHW